MMNSFGYGDHRKYHLYRKETDMRKGFDSLCGIISGELGKRVLDGDVFVFISKPHSPLTFSASLIPIRNHCTEEVKFDDNNR